MAKKNIPIIIKETEEERKSRLEYSSSMITKIIPNKKHKTRAQEKQITQKEVDRQ